MPTARTHCPDCGEPDVMDLAKLLYSPRVDYFRCRACGCWWFVPKDAARAGHPRCVWRPGCVRREDHSLAKRTLCRGRDCRRQWSVPRVRYGPPDFVPNHRVKADPDPTHVAYPRSARRRGRPVVRVAGMARSACLRRNTKTDVGIGCMLVASQTISPRT